MGPLKISENVSLAPLATWKIGGEARFFARANPENIAEALDFAKRMSLRMLVLGRGSNVLINSGKIDALVVQIVQKNPPKVDLNRGEAFAEAGTLLQALVQAYAACGARGFEKLAGIPGSVGGAVFMNAGVLNPAECSISDLFLSGGFLSEKGEIVELSRGDMNFGYRKSVLFDKPLIALSARFKVGEIVGAEPLKREIRQTVLTRLSKQPQNRKNAGSVFKAAEGGVAAGILIDKCGLKGRRRGGAMVSFKHANWIENLGGATSADVLGLISEIKDAVFKKFGAELREEVRMFGF